MNEGGIIIKPENEGVESGANGLRYPAGADAGQAAFEEIDESPSTG
jgi:hypothetical protein